jgi:hypothetical protein
MQKSIPTVIKEILKFEIDPLLQSIFSSLVLILHGHPVFFICHCVTVYNEHWWEDTESNKVW